MATTQVYANGDGTTINFSFSFPYFKTEDIKVELQEINPNGRFISSVVVTDFTVPTNNPTQIQFNTLSASTNYQTVLGAPLTNHAVNPANTIRVKIYRETNDDAVPSTFFSGSAVRAQDLNNNFDQNLYLYQELENEAVKADGGVVTGNITFDQGVTINKLPSEGTDAVNLAYLEQFAGGDSATVNTTRYREIATQGQTTVTVFPTFAVGNEVVFINGVGLSKFIEYSTPNGSTVAFTTALSAGDVIDVISYNNILVVSGDPSFDAPPFSRNAFIATAGQTVFVCTEEYTIGKEQVFLNGVLLKRGVDYTAINKVNVTLTVAALVGDLVEVHSGNYFASGLISASKSDYTYPGGVEQTVQDRLEQYVSVKDFGAKGDGVTDDTAAIQAAIDSVSGILLFPPGTYNISASLIFDGRSSNPNLIPSKIHFGDAEITATSAMDRLIYVINPHEKQRNFAMEGGILDCNSLAVLGIEIQGSQCANFSSIVIINAVGNGLQLSGETGFGVYHNTFTNLVIGLSGNGCGSYGISIASPVNGSRFNNNNTFVGVASRYCGLGGVFLRGCSANTFIGNDVEACTGPAYTFSDSTAGTTISGGYTENNQFQGSDTRLYVTGATSMSDIVWLGGRNNGIVLTAGSASIPSGSIFQDQTNNVLAVEDGITATSFNGLAIYTGNGSPEGVVAALPGSMYVSNNPQTDGNNTFFIKLTGTGVSGWGSVSITP